MLGAAHVLAMDSKNLLDVVDAIRVRYPHLNKQLTRTQDSEPNLHPVADIPPQNVSLPTPVTCTFVQFPMYPQNIQSTASSSNISTNQVIDS